MSDSQKFCIAFWIIVGVILAAWKQPLGSEDAYNTGDKVSHNDKHWVSIIDSNVWEPGVAGWTEQ